MHRAVSIDAGRLFRRLDAGPATVPALAAECGADLRTVWKFVRDMESMGRLALVWPEHGRGKRKPDLPMVARRCDLA